MNEFHTDNTTAKVQNSCLTCHYQMDAAGSPDGQKRYPKPGDCSICLNCGALAIFDDSLKLREPTTDERFEIVQDAEIKGVISYIVKRGRFR